MLPDHKHTHTHNAKVHMWHLVIFSSDSECHTAHNTKCPLSLAEEILLNTLENTQVKSSVWILHSKNILQTHKHSCVPKWKRPRRWRRLQKPAATVSPSATRGKKNNRNTRRGHTAVMKDWWQELSGVVGVGATTQPLLDGWRSKEKMHLK